ncbi:MAG: pilus assembly protein N-terminal domain-containing protein [Acidobacteria bacterium]|nr:pilus assembly protein N-terminal domain-containing protein [Acidobacteriota bacterium]
MFFPLALRVVPVVLVALTLLVLPGRISAQVTQEELTIYVNEVTTWSPGYAMGDIVLGSPATAGYEPVTGRKELMLRGKKPGRTTLNVWDQKKVLRHEITLIVTTRDALTREADLKRLLAPYPNVEISTLAGEMLLTGTVASQDELNAVTNLARVAKVQSTVRLVAPVTRPMYGTTGPVAPTGPGPGGTTPAGPDAPQFTAVEYDLELFEASVQFKTGGYGSGVEPSGRSLYKGSVSAPIGGEGEIFIGGQAMDPKQKNAKEMKDTGIRLTVRPRPGTRGGLVTAVEVETNVPLEYNLYDPDVWRRSRYSFNTTEGIPFAVSGNDLLAAPGIAGGMSAMGKATRGAQAANSVPGARGTGLQYVPVFGSLFGSRNYKTKKTQILVVFRPALVAATQP